LKKSNKMKNTLNPILLALALFTVLFSMTFFFNNGEVIPLVQSEYKWLAWIVLLSFCVLIFVFRKRFSNKQLLGVSIAYLFIPFSFQFSREGFEFLILGKNTLLALTYFIVGTTLFLIRETKKKVVID